MSCACGKTAAGPCDCCEGIEPTTPESTYNRSGLSALSFRIGTHSSFFETMLANLPRDQVGVREPSDPTIGLLDAWATVADVLTFYQERIANEGYLRTATEQRSVTELGRLVGYQPRPGVAASAYLAFSLEDGYQAEIPAGTRVQSMPDPGELPQTFETSEAIQARAAWNLLRPRTTAPQTRLRQDLRLYLEGADVEIKVNDAIVAFTMGRRQQFDFFRSLFKVQSVVRDQARNRTEVQLRPWLPAKGKKVDGVCAKLFPPFGRKILDWEPPPFLPEQKDSVHASMFATGPTGEILDKLRKPRTPAPRHAASMTRSLPESFPESAAAATDVVAAMYPEVGAQLFEAWAAQPVEETPLMAIIFRVSAANFWANAPQRMIESEPTEWSPAADEANDLVYLDAAYDGIVPGTPVLLELPGYSPTPFMVEAADTRSRSAYLLSHRSTVLDLERDWWNPMLPNEREGCKSIEPLRPLVVHAQPEFLPLGQRPIETPLCDGRIELDGLHEGLDAGRWLVVRGEIDGVPGVEAEELVMLAGALHEQKTAFQPAHTVLLLANPLAHCYRRDSVVIFGNVAHATHGESTSEVLGSGDAAVPLQRFTLRDKPVTYVSAPTPSGVESSLVVRVDGVKWPIAPGLASLGPLDRRVLALRDDDGTTRVVGGTGHRGARFSTGSENLEAAYRKGIGADGNVGAGTLKNIMTRPLGVKDVINPMRASGGADPDRRDQARIRTPIPTFALDRVVSVRDYADFALNFGGIGKAASRMVPGRGGEHVEVVIAAVDDAPLDVTSDVYQNLLLAYQRFGEGAFPVTLVIRRAVFLFMAAKVRLVEGYEWVRVEPVLRAALLDAFGFERRDLGRRLYLSQVVAVMHQVRGVACIDVDDFGGIREPESGVLTPDDVADQVAQELTGWVDVADPYELAFFTPAVPETLILTEMPP